MGLPVKKGSIGFAIFTLFFALCISAVAAYYSIVGLMAIFAGAAYAVAVMGSVLEVGKLVAASWLYNNWRRAPFLMKTYLTTAVLVLMLITSMGIFGFLSKAHLEQTAPAGNFQAKIEKIDFQIAQQQKRIDRAQGVLDQFDKVLDAYVEKEYITRGLKERAKQKPERESLRKEIDEANSLIDDLSEQKFEQQKEIQGLEAEVGPIKYIADLIYGEKENNQDLGKAVRWMIILLIFVFDPLAVLLVVAGNMSIEYARQDKNSSSSSSFPEPKEQIEEFVKESKINAAPTNKEKQQELKLEPSPDPENQQQKKDFVVDKNEAEKTLNKTATDPDGNELPIPIEAKVEPPKPYWIDIEGAVDDVFENASTSFNLHGADGDNFKKQIIKALRKNRRKT